MTDGTAAPSMPACLQALLQRLSPHDGVVDGGSDAATSVVHSPPPPSQPTSTAQALQLVDALCAHYVRLVEDVARCLPRHDGNNNSNSSSSSNAQSLDTSVRELEACAAQLQAAIHGKMQQTVRLELLHHLHSELAQREQAVARMAAAVQVARAILQPTTSAPRDEADATPSPSHAAASDATTNV